MRAETKTKAKPKAAKKVKKKEEVKTEIKAGAKKPLGCKFFCITVIVVVATHVFEDNFTSDKNSFFPKFLVAEEVYLSPQSYFHSFSLCQEEG